MASTIDDLPQYPRGPSSKPALLVSLFQLGFKLSLLLETLQVKPRGLNCAHVEAHAQRVAVDEFSRDETRSAYAPNLINRQDVRMIQS